MIITKTPFRMSFFGGGTDFNGFFNEHGGAVLSTTFDKYAYVTVRHLPPFFDYKTHLTYSKEEKVNENSKIVHPAIRNAMESEDEMCSGLEWGRADEVDVSDFYFKD